MLNVNVFGTTCTQLGSKFYRSVENRIFMQYAYMFTDYISLPPRWS